MFYENHILNFIKYLKNDLRMSYFNVSKFQTNSDFKFLK